MLIRREDFGKISDLKSPKSYKKVWFTCDWCGCGRLQAYKWYNLQEGPKLCKSCRSLYTLSKSEVKQKQKDGIRRAWEDPNSNYDREKISKITSEALKRKWGDKKFRQQMIEKASIASMNLWKNEEYRIKHKEAMKEAMKRPEVRKKLKRPSQNKFSIKQIKKYYSQFGYEVLSDEYFGANKKKLKIRCPSGHIYESMYSWFQQGSRCPECKPKYSKDEKSISDFLKTISDYKIVENSYDIIPPLEVDILIPEIKLAIEYCGLYWHGELIGKKPRNYHLSKMKLCNSKGTQLITIFEDEWLNKQDIVKRRLEYKLGLVNEKIYARKCNIEEIEGNVAKFFLNQYHIQGGSNSRVYLGAFYEDQLVAVMSFSKPSIAKGWKGSEIKVWDLNKFCTDGRNIVGVASKMLKYFMKKYEWEEIRTYSDRRWGTGNVYEKMGFSFSHNSQPNYWYFKLNAHNRVRYHRYNFRKSLLKNKLVSFDENKTEWENMSANGYDRIWDCGSAVYVLK